MSFQTHGLCQMLPLAIWLIAYHTKIPLQEREEDALAVQTLQVSFSFFSPRYIVERRIRGIVAGSLTLSYLLPIHSLERNSFSDRFALCSGRQITSGQLCVCFLCKLRVREVTLKGLGHLEWIIGFRTEPLIELIRLSKRFEQISTVEV